LEVAIVKMTVKLSTEQYRSLIAIALSTHKSLHQVIAEIVARELKKEFMAISPRREKKNKYARFSKVQRK
jgi:predicted secreted Zn-dependent protease